MADILQKTVEIDNRIAALRESLRALVEQAAAYSGAADEDLMSRRIAEQEALLDRLMKQRDVVFGNRVGELKQEEGK